MATKVVKYQDVKRHWNGFEQTWDDDRYVYIGRSHGRSKQSESVFHNPFKVGRDGTRDEVIAKYRDYLYNRPDLLRALWTLKDKTLVCWCSPEACHGDVLAELVNYSGGMSKQTPGIEWTHVPGYTGYTANPIRGCAHGCQWTMPDGDVAICYAKEVAEGLAQKAYPQGFEHISFHPEVLFSIRRKQKPCAIFIDSMSDLMGIGVKDEWIQAVIDCMVDCPQHLFFILTKHPPRLKTFEFPDNCWVGVSMPPTFMFETDGKPKKMSLTQQTRWFESALKTLGEVKAGRRWVSLEPLSWNCADLLRQYWTHIDWAVIGAASKGRTTYQPDLATFIDVKTALSGKPIFYKGNLDRELVGEWREEFYPLIPNVPQDHFEQTMKQFSGGTTLHMWRGMVMGESKWHVLRGIERQLTLDTPLLPPGTGNRFTQRFRMLPSTQLRLNQIVAADVMDYLRTVPSESVHCVVTSPPYLGQRDYGLDGQVGREDTVATYIERMVTIFREVRRVLRPDGTLWLNMGDTYNNSGKGNNWKGGGGKQATNKGANITTRFYDRTYKKKDLLLIPHRLAIALQEDGWYVRMDTVWYKKNAMPFSGTDRPASWHEYVFLLSRSDRYWYDYTAVTKPLAEKTFTTYGIPYKPQANDASGNVKSANWNNSMAVRKPALGTDGRPIGARLRSVWHDIKGERFSEAHFATYPPGLPERCILLGCPPMVCAECGTPYGLAVSKEDVPVGEFESYNGKTKDHESYHNMQKRLRTYRQAGGDHDNPFPKTLMHGYETACDCDCVETRPGVVLDPFMGAGTTAMVANRLGRQYIGCELNPDYVALADARIADDQARLDAEALAERNADPMMETIVVGDDGTDGVQLSLFS